MLPAQLILYKGNNNTHTHTHISLVYCSAQLCTTQLFASPFTVSVVLSVPNSFVVCLTHTVYVNTLTSPSLVSLFLYFVLLVFPRPCLLSPAGHDAFLILSAWVIHPLGWRLDFVTNFVFGKLRLCRALKVVFIFFICNCNHCENLSWWYSSSAHEWQTWAHAAINELVENRFFKDTPWQKINLI